MQHYFSPQQDSKITLKPVKVTIRNISLNLLTSSGVFSKKGIDAGSYLLIKAMIIKPGWKILDLGCGYGVIGLFAAKISNTIPSLVDINKRACHLAAINSKKNKIDSIVLNGNLYEPIKDLRFDTILINPPQSAGREICFNMIDGSLNHLKKDGLLQLVARPNKGGKTLAAKMKDVYGNLEIIARASGYAVYLSRHD